MRLAVAVGLFIALCAPPHAQAQDAASAFKGFCEGWMHKLQDREQINASHIKWQTAPAGVHGAYIGYTRKHTCTVKNGTASVPVGTIRYLEVRYEKQGSSIEQAEHSRPRPVETTEVTEIFRFSGGKWVY